MSEAIKIALISATVPAVASIIVQLIINGRNAKKRSAEEYERDKQRAVKQALKDERIEGRLSSIEEKLDIHNGYAKLLNNIEKSIAVIENDIKTLYKKGA